MTNLAVEFMELIAHLQLTALDLLSKNEYDSLEELLNASLDEVYGIDKEENEQEIQSANVFGTIDRQKVMQYIGDNQALMVFAQDIDNGEEFQMYLDQYIGNGSKDTYTFGFWDDKYHMSTFTNVGFYEEN